MLRKVGALYLFAFGLASMATPASASTDLPGIMVGPNNAVPACVTPGRLTAYLKSRNPKLDARYDKVATEYMRQGEMLGVRWDFAFYQMIVETGALSYWRGNRAGDVKPTQNNFAGLGATGKGERGESFADIETGVRAHLEHLLLYAGKSVENPVAQRTRNVQGLERADCLAPDIHPADYLRRHVHPVGAIQDLRQHAETGRRALPCRSVQWPRPPARPCAGGAPELGQDRRRSRSQPPQPLLPPRLRKWSSAGPRARSWLSRRSSRQRRKAMTGVPPWAHSRPRRANSQPAPFKVLNVAPPPEAPAQNIEPPAAKAPPATKASVTETKAAPAPNTQAKGRPGRASKSRAGGKGPHQNGTCGARRQSESDYRDRLRLLPQTSGAGCGRPATAARRP